MIEPVSHCKCLVSKEHVISVPEAQLSRKNFPPWKVKKKKKLLHKDKLQSRLFG